MSVRDADLQGVLGTSGPVVPGYVAAAAPGWSPGRPAAPSARQEICKQSWLLSLSGRATDD